jgi:hypothetical protein
MFGDACRAALQRVGGLLQQADLQPGFQRSNGDARSHGASADDGDMGESTRGCRQAGGQPGGLPLDPELVAQGGRFAALHQRQEQLALTLHAGVKRQRAGPDGVHQGLVSRLRALALVQAGGRFVERLIDRGGINGSVACPRQWQGLRCDCKGQGRSRSPQVLRHHQVQQPGIRQLFCSLCLPRAHHRQRRTCTHQARQFLGGARPGDQAQLDFRRAQAG